MPKAKLKFPADSLKKVKVSAHFSNVKLGDSVKIGNNVNVEVSYRSATDLVEMGTLMATVTGNELDALQNQPSTAKGGAPRK